MSCLSHLAEMLFLMTAKRTICVSGQYPTFLIQNLYLYLKSFQHSSRGLPCPVSLFLQILATVLTLKKVRTNEARGRKSVSAQDPCGSAPNSVVMVIKADGGRVLFCGGGDCSVRCTLSAHSLFVFHLGFACCTLNICPVADCVMFPSRSYLCHHITLVD